MRQSIRRLNRNNTTKIQSTQPIVQTKKTESYYALNLINLTRHKYRHTYTYNKIEILHIQQKLYWKIWKSSNQQEKI